MVKWGNPCLLSHENSHGNIFCITGPLWGESPVTGGFPHKGQWRFYIFFDLQLSKQLKCHCAHYDVTVMHWILQNMKQQARNKMMDDLLWVMIFWSLMKWFTTNFHLQPASFRKIIGDLPHSWSNICHTWSAIHHSSIYWKESFVFWLKFD